MLHCYQNDYTPTYSQQLQQQRQQQPAESAQSAFQDDMESVHPNQTVSSHTGKDGRGESLLQEVKANLEHTSTSDDPFAE